MRQASPPGDGGLGASVAPRDAAALQSAIVHKNVARSSGFCGRGGGGRLTKCCAKELCPTRDRNSKKRVALRTCVQQLNAEIPCNDSKIYLQAVRTYCNLEARATDWECNTKSELYSPTAALLASIVDSYADSKTQCCS